MSVGFTFVRWTQNESKELASLTLYISQVSIEQVLGLPVLNSTKAAIWIIRFPWEIQLDVIGVESKQNVMDYAAEWEYEEEEDELVIEKAEL